MHTKFICFDLVFVLFFKISQTSKLFDYKNKRNPGVRTYKIAFNSDNHRKN